MHTHKNDFYTYALFTFVRLFLLSEPGQFKYEFDKSNDAGTSLALLYLLSHMRRKKVRKRKTINTSQKYKHLPFGWGLSESATFSLPLILFR